MNKYAILIALLVIISSVSAFQIGISPERILTNTNANEEICANFTLYGENNSIFLGEIFWSDRLSKEINDYRMNSDKKGVEVKYPSQTFSGKKQICFTAKRAGEYYGAIIYKLYGTNYAIGTWILLEVKNGNTMMLTGEAIKDFQKGKTINLLLFFILIALLALLYFALRGSIKRKFCKN